MALINKRPREWIAWAVTVHLDLVPPLREQQVAEIVEPRFDTDLLELLRPWSAHLHPLIVRCVLRESRIGTWLSVGSTDPPPPPIERRPYRGV